MIDFLGWVFILLLLLISILNIFIIIFVAYHGFKLGLFHINFRLLQLQEIISTLIMSIGCTLLVFMIFNEGQITVPYDSVLSIRMVMLYGDSLRRLLSIAFVIERTFATIKRKDYENKSYRWLPYILIAIIQIFSTIFVLLLYYWRMDTIIFVSITLIFDGSSLGFTYFLRWWNRRLRKITNAPFLTLTQRYQLTENIRAMNSIHPLLLAIAISNLGSMGLSWISLQTGFLSQYIELIFHLILNTSIVISLFVLLYKENIYRERILCRLPLVKKIFNWNKQDFGKTSNKVVNVDGELIIHNMNHDHYFDKLKQAWK